VRAPIDPPLPRPTGCVYVYRPESCFNAKDSRTKYTGAIDTLDYSRQCFMYSSYDPDLIDTGKVDTWDPVWRSDEWCSGTTRVEPNADDLGGKHAVYRHAYSTCYDSKFTYTSHSFGHADEISTGIAVFDLDANGMFDVVRACDSN
jgi:hypothetical protein